MKFDKTLVEEELSVCGGGFNVVWWKWIRPNWMLFCLVFFVVVFFLYKNFNKMWGLCSNMKHEGVVPNQEWIKNEIVHCGMLIKIRIVDVWEELIVTCFSFI
jgi:hypothetical protein